MARGTLQRCRDGVDTREIGSPALALRPPEMPLEVADVWAEYIEAVVANGGRQCDAETFAEWCAMTSVLRRCRNSVIDAEADRDDEVRTQAAPAPASYVQQWRQLGELLGLAGPKSRLVPKGGAADAGKAANPFSRNGPAARR